LSRIKKDIDEVFALMGKDWDILKNSNILISGGTGFFGKSIVLSLIHANNLKNLNLKIYIIRRDENSHNHFEIVKDKYGIIKYIKSDIRHFKSTDLNINYIIHAATNSNREFIKNNPTSTLDTIVIGTKKLLEFSKTQEKLKSFLFISSGAVNSANRIHNTPISENDIYPMDTNDQLSSYSSGKKTAEKHLMEYQKKYNIPIKILRGFTFIGPQINLNQKLALTYLFNCFLNNKDINVLNPECKRSYMYTSDLVNWILKVMIYAKSGSIYNLGSNEEITIKDLAKKILKYNNKIKLIENMSTLNDYYVPDIKSIKKELGLEITVSLDESIKRLVEYYKE
tara:strand:- start:456 stop:1472 length:1017 start_codon:yes stop_codon:yes gene_type:complete